MIKLQIIHFILRQTDRNKRTNDLMLSIIFQKTDVSKLHRRNQK
jgi:hypothetical protein